MSTNVVAFGEVIWDLLPQGKVLGGAPANFCYRLNQLGTHASLISRVGDDDLGREATAFLQSAGIPAEALQVDRIAPTGTAIVSLSPDGDPEFELPSNVAYDSIEANAVALELVRRASYFYFGTLAQRASASRKSLQHLVAAAPTATTIVDLNLRPRCYDQESVEFCLNHSEILKLNVGELKIIYDQLGIDAEHPTRGAEVLFFHFPIQTILLTAGAQGVTGFTRGGEVVELPCIQVEVCDTVGSGDSFTAGFVHAKLRGDTFEQCCRFANNIAAQSSSLPGAMSPIPIERIR